MAGEWCWVLCAVEYLAASLDSRCQEHPSSKRDTQKCLQPLPNVHSAVKLPPAENHCLQLFLGATVKQESQPRYCFHILFGHWCQYFHCTCWSKELNITEIMSSVQLFSKTYPLGTELNSKGTCQLLLVLLNGTAMPTDFGLHLKQSLFPLEIYLLVCPLEFIIWIFWLGYHPRSAPIVQESLRSARPAAPCSEVRVAF